MYITSLLHPWHSMVCYVHDTSRTWAVSYECRDSWMVHNVVIMCWAGSAPWSCSRGPRGWRRQLLSSWPAVPPPSHYVHSTSGQTNLFLQLSNFFIQHSYFFLQLSNFFLQHSNLLLQDSDHLLQESIQLVQDVSVQLPVQCSWWLRWSKVRSLRVWGLCWECGGTVRGCSTRWTTSDCHLHCRPQWLQGRCEVQQKVTCWILTCLVMWHDINLASDLLQIKYDS